MRVRANGLLVFVPKYGIEGPAFYADAEAGGVPGVAGDGASLPAGDWSLSADACAAAPPGGDPDAAPVVRVFDPVAVRVSVDEGGRTGRARLVLTLVARAGVADKDRAGA